MLKTTAVLLLALGCLPMAVARSAEGEKKELIVFAAASLTDAFKELGALFEKQRPDAAVRFSFAGSNQLRTQIEHGAKADVFASANMKELALAVKSGVVSDGAGQVFAKNKLVVALPKDNPAGLKELSDLARPGLKLVLADAAVPVGKYALEMLERISKSPAYGADFSAKVLKNLVSKEQSVKAVVAKIKLGEGDAGVVYVSDLLGTDLQTLPVPDEFNPLAMYPLAPVSTSAQPTLANEFVALVLSAEGQTVLQKHGFLPGVESAK